VFGKPLVEPVVKSFNVMLVGSDFDCVGRIFNADSAIMLFLALGQFTNDFLPGIFVVELQQAEHSGSISLLCEGFPFCELHTMLCVVEPGLCINGYSRNERY
jgi:hypothetical protein